ncbi:MAG TPA: FKBP-type peptidyl-prolyl cis-trans isomerase [Bacteroidia bacterium]|nr:FKBP-type peptidyl-prolyl cis-trans isomerase [Bacteroidia bacterium]
MKNKDSGMQQRKMIHGMVYGGALWLLCSIFFFSCKEEKVPGFRRLENGSYFKLISLGDNNRKPQPGDYLELSLANKIGDSLLYDSHLESSKGTILAPYNEKDGYSRLHEGDSAVFLIPAYDVMPLGKDSMMQMQVRLYKILDEKQYKEEEARRQHIDEMDEQKILSYYLRTNKQSYKSIGRGAYYFEEKPGKGKGVERGDRVLLNYTGQFLNGKQFDATNEPVEFTLGDEGQLLEGMAMGLTHMREGGKAKFIIPSHLAYGAEGSSAGIVKPYTTIVYEVELIKIN